MNRRYIPNALTCGNLICGCIATGAGFHHHFLTAFLFILLGAVFDFFDGFAARLLKAPSKMGIELDSLADDVTFGVAPSSMIFTLFTEVRYPELIYNPFWFKFLPFTAFLLAAFSAYRLAKFNLDERQRLDFIGLPTPACAIFWASFISSSEAYLVSPRFNAPFLLAFVLMFCFLLISEIPMFSFKMGKGIAPDPVARMERISLVSIAAIAAILTVFTGQHWSLVPLAVFTSYIVISLVFLAVKRPEST